jgi:chromosome segregation ATPase
MLTAVKNTFNNLQSQTVMNQNATTISGLNQVLIQETQQKNSAYAQLASSQAQVASATSNLNNIRSLNNKLKNDETNAKNLLTQNQTQAQLLDSYLTDFASNEFEDVSLIGGSINSNQN